MVKRVAPRPFQEVERLSITVITDNYIDALRPDTKVSTRYRSTPGASIHAEHGLSYFIETVTAGGASTLIFDYGVDARGVLNNIRLLNVDLARIDALGLSHGHFDHWGALIGILEENRSVIPKGVTLYVGEEAFAHRYAARVQGGELHDIGRLDREAIERFGVTIVEVTEPTEIIPGAYLTGPIARITGYERVPPIFFIDRDEGREQDQFPGEQALAFVVKGKGLIVLSGCAHVGIVNTIRHAQWMTGVEKTHAIIGGFHLVNATEDIIDATVADIKAMEPDYVVPTHCTGFEAISRLREEMADRFLLNTAGTTYVFGAPDGAAPTFD